LSLTASTEEIPGSLKIYVTKNGFYRWYYFCPGFPIFGGVTHFTEDILNKLFPNAKEDGKDTPHEIFLTLSAAP